MNLKPTRLLLVLLAIALPQASALAAPPKADGATVAKVNGVAIPKSRADAVIAEQVAQGGADTPELRTQVREELVRREVLAQEAKKKGLDKRPDVSAQMALAQQAVLIRAFVQDYAKANPIPEDQIKKEYEAITSQLGKKEYKARHILVEKEDEAKSIIEKLKGGGKFDELAKQSKDPGSKDKGGDLGWSMPANYVKPFADAMMALEKGKYTAAPVKSDFGYHVIQLDDVRDAKFPTLDEAKPGLTQRLQQQQVEKIMADLRAKAKVE
jgi:peptidyl-prolyl cis-trans isomerase C